MSDYLDTPHKRVKWILTDKNIKQITLADASGMTAAGISDALKNKLQIKIMQGLNLLVENVNWNWVVSGEGAPYIVPGAGADQLLYIDEERLNKKLNALELRIKKLENLFDNEGND